jgi:hypothetical protein
MEATTHVRRGRPRNVSEEIESDRPDMRPVLREDDPRALAEKRAAEIMEALGDDIDGTDEFYVDPASVPSGWSYEWKRHTILNKEDPSYQVDTMRRGWTPVPANRHPEMMPTGWSGDTIDRKGMRLYERPATVTDHFKARDLSKARDQVRTKQAQLNAAPPGTFERQNKDAPLAKIKQSYEPMPIPADH